MQQMVECEHPKARLLKMLREMERPLLTDELAAENAPDAIDRVQRAAERDFTVRRMESGFNRLQAIRLALQRIDEGTYGTCMHCGRMISGKRLDAVPWAACCIACQEILDRENQERETPVHTEF